jgi:DNA replication ATP-dependent helicase Dna2
VSLFKLLSDHHTEAVVDLSYQYRMNADIMSLSNTLIYNNRLKCGTDSVANQTLELPAAQDSHDCKTDSCWIAHALQPRSEDEYVSRIAKLTLFPLV